MNCHICGEEREVAGYICQPCLDEEKAAELKEKGLRLLSPREAVIALLDGAALVTDDGTVVVYNEKEYGFVDKETGQPWYCFAYLYLKVE